MKNLAIPLGKSQTTRQRRVVSWRLALCLMTVMGAAAGAGWWFGHDQVSRAAPEGTVGMLRFTPRPATWDLLESLLGDVALISNRPFTARDLRPFVSGEFALFIGEDGHRSLAVRMSKSRLPAALLDTYGVTTQQVSGSVFLLSDRPESVSGIKPAWPFTLPPAPWSGLRRLGVAVFPGSASARIYGMPGMMEWRWKDLGIPKADVRVTEDIMAFMSTPLLQNDLMAWMAPPLNSMVVPLGGPDAGTIGKWASAPGLAVLSKSGGYLLSINMETFGEQDPKRLLRMAAALQAPSKAPWLLEDGTSATEIRVDPTGFAVETSVRSGHEVFSSVISAELSMYAATLNDSVILTNDASLLDSQIEGKVKEKSDNPCVGNAIFIRLQDMIGDEGGAAHVPKPSILNDAARLFSSISLNTSWMQTKMTLCK